MKYLYPVVFAVLLVPAPLPAQEFEFVNNFLMNLSFITGTDRGMEQNLEDNFTWMQQQGYTHLRFFGIFPNGYHCFPSPTLDANGFPNHPYLEGTLELLVPKANEHGITVNFDGWEVLAGSNYDTTELGVSFITEDELAAIVSEVLAFGVTLVTEEQFESSYMQAIQSVTQPAGAIHETTSGLWWPGNSVADALLWSVFSYYHYDQVEADLLVSTGSCPPCNLGLIHWGAESVRYFSIPFSIAVGSFGTLEAENWKNVLIFAQIQHQPQRISIEETRTDITIWDPEFNFMDYVGNEIVSYGEQLFAQRPIMNLVFDGGVIPGTEIPPAYYAGLVDGPAIVNIASLLGYRVVATLDSVLAEAEAYYLMLGGGPTAEQTIPLPDWVLPQLDDDKPVFLHPSYGIPTQSDSAGWQLVRQFFGAPVAQTVTLENLVPGGVQFQGHSVKWGGVSLYLIPRVERLLSSEIDTSAADVVLSDEVDADSVALLVQRGNKILVNSNIVHLEASYILSALLGGPLHAPATADIAVSDTIVIVFAEYDTYVDVDLPWESETHLSHRDAVGDVIQEADLDLSGRYESSLLRGELVILTGHDISCCETVGDINHDGLGPNIVDLTFLTAYLFGGGAAPPCDEEANVDGDEGGLINIVDLTYLVAYLFGGGPAPGPCP